MGDLITFESVKEMASELMLYIAHLCWILSNAERGCISQSEQATVATASLFQWGTNFFADQTFVTGP